MVLDSFGVLMVERRLPARLARGHQIGDLIPLHTANHLTVVPRGGKLPENVLDTDIESIRRNPALADLFQRMSFMERRGSGLRKICHETMAKDNYEDRFLPRFEDKNGFFRVILWDMNYRESDKTDQVTDQVIILLSALGEKELSAVELMGALSLSHRPTFRTNYLNPALESGLIERTIPDKPNSRLQKYRRTR